MRLKLLFAGLYFVQGATICFFSFFQKPYLAEIGIDRAAIGLLYGILLLPFILKVLFGWLSDRFPLGRWGHRKPYMVGGLVSGLICFAAAGGVSPEHFLLYAFLVIGASFSIALFDAATDGLAVDRSGREDPSQIQAYMVGGKALGVIIVSAGMGFIIDRYGFHAALFSLSILFSLPALLCIFLKPSPRQVQEESAGEGQNRVIVFWLGAIGLLYSVSAFGTDGLVTLFLSEEYGLSDSDIGIYGSVRGVGAVAGAIAAGLLGIAGPKKMGLSLSLVALGAVCVGHGMNTNTYLWIGGMWGFCWGANEVAFLGIAMHAIHRSRSGAFVFAGLMALCNLGTALGEMVGTSLTQVLSFQMVFTLLAIFVSIPLLLLMRARSHLN